MRPSPPAPFAERTVPPASAATGRGDGRRRARLFLTVALALLAVPALAQSRSEPDPRDPTRRTTARPAAARSTASRPATTRPSALPLRGSVDARRGNDPQPAAALEPLDGADRSAYGERLIDPDPLAVDPLDRPAPGGRRPATDSSGRPISAAQAGRPPAPGEPARLDPATGRPMELGPDARRAAADAASRTGTVRTIPPVPALQAVQPRPRDLQADQRSEAVIEDDAYAQLGLRTGGFTWLPAIETSTGWSSNIATRAGGASGMTYRIAPELLGRSDWSRHQLQFELRGAYLGNMTDRDYDKPTFQGTMRGRVDLGDETRIDVKAGWSHDRQSPSSADNPADTVVPATVETKSGSLGLTRDVGLLALTLRGDVDRADYSGGTTSSGASLGAEVQNNTRWVGAFRAAYGSKGTIRPFVEIQASRRAYDEPLISGDARDTNGAAVKAGVVADLGPTLRGEISTGWGVERPERGTLPDMSGWLLDGSLVWSPTRLTTVKLDAKTGFEATTLAGATGSVVRTVAVSVDHALRRDLVASAGVSLSDKRYVGANLREDDLVFSSGLTYKVDRNIQTFVKGSLERFTSSSSASNYDAATVMVGVRLQR